MTTATLLVELQTEELPPKSLAALGQAFANGIRQDLIDQLLVRPEAKWRWYATPRRLALQIDEVSTQQAPRLVDDKIMPVSVAFDSSGNPTLALLKKLKAKNFRIEDLPAFDRRMDGKTETLYFRWTDQGFALEQLLSDFVSNSISKLPIRKRMRWGDGDAEFVRPAHSLVMLHGSNVVWGTVLGIPSSNKTRGHRFMGQPELTIPNAEAYETVLAKDGMVIADFAQRRSMIDGLLQAEAKKQQATLGEYKDLLDEVTALVEHPSVYVGAFDKGFLEVPAECLILTMRQNQKYFPLFDGAGKLTSKFLIVSNMQVADPAHIISGNQRVIRPRLEDARFFYNQDRKERLETRVPRLEKVVYHNKLGTQLQRVQRVQLLAGKIAQLLNANIEQAKRAAWLAKADLTTGMVGEFPELQGIMGRYYALHDGEPAAVAGAIAEHYSPRYAGDQLPESPVACAVALADKLETLVGMFGIGQLPTGDRDPFALRRHALGVIRILIERNLPLSITDLIKNAFAVFPKELKLANANADLEKFVFERMRSYFSDNGYTAQEIEAVLAMPSSQINLVPSRLEAVKAFKTLPEAKDLAAANKRIQNILKQAKTTFDGVAKPELLKEKAEVALSQEIRNIRGIVEFHFDAREYEKSLLALAKLRPFVDTFFDEVMVNDENPDVRQNRIRLLGELGHIMNLVADISKLAA